MRCVAVRVQYHLFDLRVEVVVRSQLDAQLITRSGSDERSCGVSAKNARHT